MLHEVGSVVWPWRFIPPRPEGISTTQYDVPLPSPSVLALLLKPKPTSVSESSSRNYTDLKQERTVGDGTPAAKQDKCLAALPLLHNPKKEDK